MKLCFDKLLKTSL